MTCQLIHLFSCQRPILLYLDDYHLFCLRREETSCSHLWALAHCWTLAFTCPPKHNIGIAPYTSPFGFEFWPTGRAGSRSCCATIKDSRVMGLSSQIDGPIGWDNRLFARMLAPPLSKTSLNGVVFMSVCLFVMWILHFVLPLKWVIFLVAKKCSWLFEFNKLMVQCCKTNISNSIILV